MLAGSYMSDMTATTASVENTAPSTASEDVFDFMSSDGSGMTASESPMTGSEGPMVAEIPEEVSDMALPAPEGNIPEMPAAGPEATSAMDDSGSSETDTTSTDTSAPADTSSSSSGVSGVRARFAALRGRLLDIIDARLSTAEPVILGGVNDLGVPVDAVNADFTRSDGTLPVTEFSFENLGATEDGNVRVRITQTNLAAENGIFLTPTFVAIQDGTYDLFDNGGTASPGLEMLAEDGGVEGVVDQFNGSGAVGATGVISGSAEGMPTPLAPGATGTVELEIDPTTSRYLTFAQMVLPSNDAFIASPDDPMGIELFDSAGNFIAEDITLTGNDVLDAGTEVNTEMDAAFINQTAPNTGETEGGVIRSHIGFIGSERFENASLFDLFR